MQAVRIHQHGDPSVLRVEDVPKPAPGPGQALVRVLGVSLNHLDLWVRRGMPGFPVPFPRILGCDGTGEVADALAREYPGRLEVMHRTGRRGPRPSRVPGGTG